jgi:hypothetical protein
MARRHSPSRRAGRIAIGAAAIVSVAGLAGCGSGSDIGDREPPRKPTAPPAPGPVGPGPARPFVASPSGSAPNRDGAVAAAVSFVTNGQALLDLDPVEAERTLREHAASATAEAQVGDLRQRLAAIHRALAGGTGPIRYWQAVLATRVQAFSPERAQVAVWHVGVLARAGVAPPQAGWAVSVVDLVWERGDWKLEHEAVTAGPAPMLDASAEPTSNAQLAAALDGFDPGLSR